MTLERNHAAHARHSTADAANQLEPQFAAMLRSHLQRQSAQPIDCAGFDADVASAYLERALAVGLQAQYETHLAACPTCRHHLLAFASLNEQVASLAQPVVIKQPQTAQPATVLAGKAWRPLADVRERWHAHLAGWFTLPGWHWGVAATGLAAMLVAGMLSWQFWPGNQTTIQSNAPTLTASTDALLAQNSTQDQDKAQLRLNESFVPLAAAGAPAANASKPAQAPAQAPAHADDARAGELLALATTANNSAVPAMSRQRGVPQPNVPLLDAFALPAQPDVRVLASSLSVPSSLVATSLTGDAPRAVPTHIEVRELGALRKSAQLPLLTSESFTVMAGHPGGAQPVRLGPSNFDQPMQGFARLNGEVQPPIGEIVAPQFKRLTKREQDELALKERELAKLESAKNNSNPRNILSSLGRGAVTSFLPGKLGPGKLGEEARPKEAEKNDAVLTAPKPLMQQIYGRTFYFERGFWIDEEYRSDTVLPLIRLVRGNQRYQQILIENPGLEQFFKLGQVIVIWKGKVYEVRKS